MSLLNYHKATTHELLAVTNRVRNLISHWGEDGRYKEAILKNILKRFLPERYSISTGFIVKQTENRGEHLSSRQIDLIIHDSINPVLFKEGDFVILTPDSVRGIIEVKANVQNQGISNVVRQANENGQFIFSGRNNNTSPFFNGIFSYDGDNDCEPITIEQNLIRANELFLDIPGYTNFKVNHISLNKDFFIKFWEQKERPHSLYNIQDLSFPFFISNLIDTLSENSVQNNNYIWFVANKELNLIHQF